MFSLFLLGSLFADTFSAQSIRFCASGSEASCWVISSKKTILTKIEPAEKPAQPLTKSDEESG